MRYTKTKDRTRGRKRLEEKEPIVESESTGRDKIQDSTIGEIGEKVGRP